MRLVNKYTVERLDFLAPESFPNRAKLYFKSNGIDNAVFGEIERSEDGVYTFIVKGWERSSDSIVVQTEETSDSVFDMFDIVDSLTIEFIEELSGEHIGFGKINFINQGAEADYNIYVDGNYLGRNIEESEILFGERTFKITAPGSFGDTVVETVTVNVEENGSHNIVFSMGEADPAITPSNSDEVTAIGNLFIDADPIGSEVFLDNQSIGLTPLALYGVGAGLYDLRVGSEYYVPETQVLRLEPNVDNTLSFDLDINVENPYIKKKLKDPGNITLISGGITASQIAWILFRPFILNTDGAGPGMLTDVELMLMSIRSGHLLAGDGVTGAALSIVTYMSLLGFRGVYPDIFGDSSDLYYITMTVGLMIYDLIFAPFAVVKHNTRMIEMFKKERVKIDNIAVDPFRIVVQAGGGGIVHAGATWSPLWNWLWFEQLVGISLTQYADILKPAFSGISKIYVYPFSNSFNFFRPYIGGLFNISTDLTTLNMAYGFISGFDISLEWFDIFLEVEMFLDNTFGNSPSLMALGVRL